MEDAGYVWISLGSTLKRPKEATKDTQYMAIHHGWIRGIMNYLLWKKLQRSGVKWCHLTTLTDKRVRVVFLLSYRSICPLLPKKDGGRRLCVDLPGLNAEAPKGGRTIYYGRNFRGAE
jgi:hypothetical protein